MMRRLPKTRRTEKEHHETYEESLDSRLCKLRVTTLGTKGRIPKRFIQAWSKSQVVKNPLSTQEQLDAEVYTEYVERFKSKNHNHISITPWQSNILLGFCEFIDNPLRCHQGRLAKLQYCKSLLKGLQDKQRVALVKVVTTLFSFMSIETGFIGEYNTSTHGELVDEKGDILLQGVQHYLIRSRYEQIWSEPISKSKYFDCLTMLKLSEFFEVELCYLSNEEAEIKRAELREKGASVEEIEAIPRVYSEPAYKRMTEKFFDVFKERINSEHMLKSKAHAVKKRIKKKLSLMYTTYTPFSNGFFTKVRREFMSMVGRIRYPQAANSAIKATKPNTVPIH